jgi:hypothetical protein
LAPQRCSPSSFSGGRTRSTTRTGAADPGFM